MVEQIDLFNCQENTEKVTKEVPTDLEERITKVLDRKPLNERQKALFRLIRYNSLELHRKTTQKEVCMRLKEYGYEWNDNPKAHDHCTMIWSDIVAIDTSAETHKLIISKNFEYWIGSERETEEYVEEELWGRLVPSLYRYWTYHQKIKKNGQGTLIDCNGKVINEKSKAERFIEAFNDYDIELQRKVNDYDK